jgi:hypothetical protein
LYLALSDRLLVADVGGNYVSALCEGDLEHRHDSAELEMVQSLDKRLVFINDGDVADLIDLVESLDSVLDQLGEVDS